MAIRVIVIVMLQPSLTFWVGRDRPRPSTFSIVFSRAVTNVGIVFKGADDGEEFTFTINDMQPIQLKSNSSCQENISITDNKVSFNGTRLGGNITVGGVWFTELTFQHNGEGADSLINFCLDNSVVQ